MAFPPGKDSLSDLERHTRLLEANVEKLTTALEHWQLLEAEYEALLDEVSRAERESPAPAADLVRIRRDFDGQVVDAKTVAEIFGARTGQPVTKTPQQIAGVIDRRLDYVRTNAGTLRKQVEAASNKLAVAQVVSRPDMMGDGGADGDPITDIVEELDDDDNVVNYRLHTPSSTQPKVLEALKKAGIDELPEGEKGKQPEAPQKKNIQKTAREPAPAPATTNGSTTNGAKPKPKPVKKGVSFAEDTKPGHEESSPSTPSYAESLAAQRLDKIMKTAKEQESMVSKSSAILPVNESMEDAEMRREMLEYGMSEIGPIVAQLNLEEGSDDDDDEDMYGDNYDEDYDDDEDDEDEDNFGRSKYSVIDEAYRERMRELEKKLGVAPLEQGDKSTLTGSATSDKVDKGGVGVIRVAGGESTEDNPTTSSVAMEVESKPKKNGLPNLQGKYKTVSFASALDIAPEEPEKTEAPKPKPAAESSEPRVDPMSTTIVERGSGKKVAAPSAPTATVPTASKPAKKPSRFKMARKGAPDAAVVPAPIPAAASTSIPALPKGPHQAPVRFLDQERTVAPTGPEGQTLANAVVERQPTSTPTEPDELDATLLMQETATAYHRTRNQMIQKQGGFLQASQEAIQPAPDGEENIIVDDSGRPRRISKFKAARLSKQ